MFGSKTVAVAEEKRRKGDIGPQQQQLQRKGWTKEKGCSTAAGVRLIGGEYGVVEEKESGGDGRGGL